jgi:acyl-CoA synthetase (NDP forming)
MLRSHNAAAAIAGKETEQASQGIAALSVFFNPKSVAVVGASSDPKKPGNTALRHMISMGYKGKLYPVNPREKGILGLPCYKSVSDIPEPVDLCVLMVAAELTVPVAKELLERKRRFDDVRGAICMSAGFGEIDAPEAKQRQKDLIDTLNAASIRLIGPNCVGVMDTISGFNTNFDIGHYPHGGISVLTQSGAFGNSFLFASGTSGRVGLNKYVSMGNMADVQMAELLTYLKDDESTRVIGIYLEGLKEPRAFFTAAAEAAAIKPVVVLKSGRSELGTTAALSHTGAIAGAEAIYDGAFRQFGLMRVHSVAEFYDTLRAFSMQPVPQGNRVAVLTHMGGPGTMCIDEISESPGLQMASFTEETTAALKAILSPAANVGHPPGYIDLTAAHFERLHHQVLQILFKDPNVDTVIQILAPSAFLDQPLLALEVSNAFHAQGVNAKPLLNVITFGDFADNLRRGLESARLPTFDYPDTVARVAANLAKYASMRAPPKPSAAEAKTPHADKSVVQTIAAARKDGRSSLLEPEAYAVCKQYGIATPPFKLVDSVDAALAATKDIGYPVVIKVVSAKILHKSDIGGVMLGIGSDAALEKAYTQLVTNVRKAAPDLTKPTVLVQKMMPSATELVLGAVRDRLFGPVVMFGLGGIYVEVLKRVGFRLAPFCLDEARALIKDTLPPKILAGARGRKKLDIDAIAAMLVSLGRLLEENPQIEEVDLNPCLALDDGCLAVDARIILGKAT